MDSVGEKHNKYTIEELDKIISKNGFAIVTEMVFRKFQEERKMGLIWHLTPEEAIANGIKDYDI